MGEKHPEKHPLWRPPKLFLYVCNKPSLIIWNKLSNGKWEEQTNPAQVSLLARLTIAPHLLVRSSEGLICTCSQGQGWQAEQAVIYPAQLVPHDRGLTVAPVWWNTGLFSGLSDRCLSTTCQTRTKSPSSVNYFSPISSFSSMLTANLISYLSFFLKIKFTRVISLFFPFYYQYISSSFSWFLFFSIFSLTLPTPICQILTDVSPYKFSLATDSTLLGLTTWHPPGHFWGGKGKSDRE